MKQGKIAAIERRIIRWANSDDDSATDALIDIMEVLDLDPYDGEQPLAHTGDTRSARVSGDARRSVNVD